MSSINQRLNFFLWAYLRINPDDLLKLDDSIVVKRIILKCADKAYQDLKRSIKYSKSVSEINELKTKERKKYCLLKREFYREVTEVIVSNIIKEEGLLSLKDICPRKIIRTVYQVKNNMKYCLLFKDEKKFTVGIAQKWVNMTLKYLWLIGIFDDKYEKNLEVPIDKYILNEIKKLNISIPKNPWSKWDDIEEYSKLQDTLYETLYLNGYTRISWENKQWIKAANEKIY